ncbi:hypothetical protein AUJ46_02320 [Candidatus Peregrinibacteria bacterium CG1_02_54_53]|nr:MAG: hypothetical protein AUJ46_02320 [Candidatus Peregrinibacteria bacterium CG1_02_54_53]
MELEQYFQRRFPLDVQEAVRKFSHKFGREDYFHSQDFQERVPGATDGAYRSIFLCFCALGILMDELMHTHFSKDYEDFRAVTRFPKVEYGITGIHAHPWTILREQRDIPDGMFENCAAVFLRNMRSLFADVGFPFTSWKDVESALIADEDVGEGKYGKLLLRVLKNDLKATERPVRETRKEDLLHVMNEEEAEEYIGAKKEKTEKFVDSDGRMIGSSMETTSLTPRIRKAMELATSVHGTMKRKVDGLPYMTHPMAVFQMLSEWEADEDTQIAGLLHDVLEDAPGNLQEKYRKEIKEQFGQRVLALVESVTEEDKSLPWRERKERYLAHLKKADRSSLLITCADRIHNSESLVSSLKKEGEAVWKKLNAPKQQQLWFIVQVEQILSEKLGGRYALPLKVCIYSISMFPPRDECLWFYIYDDWDGTELTCPTCEWKGTMKDEDMETHDTLLDFSCPGCDKILAIVRYPTIEQVQEDALKGDENAKQYLAKSENTM